MRAGRGMMTVYPLLTGAFPKYTLVCGHGISMCSSSKRFLIRLRSSPVSPHCIPGLVKPRVPMPTP